MKMLLPGYVGQLEAAAVCGDNGTNVEREITWLNLRLCVCVSVCVCNHLCPFLAVVNIAGLCESELCDDRYSLSRRPF